MTKTESGGPPTIAEIDLAALGANYRAIRSAGNGAGLMAVVKADAYGHGAVEVTRALRDEGCGHFGVARVCEARELRAAGVRERIYLLGGFLAGEVDEIVALDLTPDPRVLGFTVGIAIHRASRTTDNETKEGKCALWIRRC